jgi:2-methylcitrate dehydratase PrpD
MPTTAEPVLGIDLLADLVTSSAHGDIPTDVRERAKIRILDAIGCAALGSNNRLAGRVLTLATRLDTSGPASHWFSRSKGSVQNAAFVNSVLVHNLANDDVGAGGHPGSNVIPTAIAVAEVEGRSGADVISAVALGYEVQTRLGRPAFMAEIEASALRSTTIFGAFGAAATAARLLELTAEQTANALSYAASLAVPAIEEPLRHSTTDERSIQMGANTLNGVLSALSAEIGLSGTPWALAGDCGLFGAYGHAPGIPEGVLDGLGVTWRENEAFFKPYPGGYGTGVTQCAMRFASDRGVHPDDILSVHAKMSDWGNNTGYSNPGPHETIEQATMSTVFGLAAAFNYGDYSVKIMRQAFEDPRVQEFTQRVRLERMEGWSVYDGEVTIELKDGRCLTEVADIPESMVHPSWEDEVKKFHAFSDPVLDAEERERVVNEVRNLDERPDVSRLIGVLSRTPTPNERRCL